MGAVCSVLGMNAIELRNVSVDYYLGNEDAFSFKNVLLNFYAKGQKPKSQSFRALNDISFCISKGEKVGIIGLNGSGKTTLLRLLSGIFQPTSGQAIISGNVSPLLDFQTGFEEHLTGLENIRIRLMFLGLSKAQAEEKITEIVDFSELGEFIDRPVRTYSAGMALRLAFATSTAIHPEILIADEVIGTGDAQFAEKAKKRLESFLSMNCTMVLSSHSMELVHNYCTRIIWLSKGKIMADGCAEDIIKEYKSSYAA
jgi:ABC-type polysaccharide/polyol phosphate transport system ATPase subunit